MKTETWSALDQMIGSQEVLVTEVQVVGRDVAIRGVFELPPLAKLSHSDQIFIAAFVRCHGSIKEM